MEFEHFLSKHFFVLLILLGHSEYYALNFDYIQYFPVTALIYSSKMPTLCSLLFKNAMTALCIAHILLEVWASLEGHQLIRMYILKDHWLSNILKFHPLDLEWNTKILISKKFPGDGRAHGVKISLLDGTLNPFQLNL